MWRVFFTRKETCLNIRLKIGRLKYGLENAMLKKTIQSDLAGFFGLSQAARKARGVKGGKL